MVPHFSDQSCATEHATCEVCWFSNEQELWSAPETPVSSPLVWNSLRTAPQVTSLTMFATRFKAYYFVTRTIVHLTTLYIVLLGRIASIHSPHKMRPIGYCYRRSRVVCRSGLSLCVCWSRSWALQRLMALWGPSYKVRVTTQFFSSALHQKMDPLTYKLLPTPLLLFDHNHHSALWADYSLYIVTYVQTS